MCTNLTFYGISMRFSMETWGRQGIIMTWSLSTPIKQNTRNRTQNLDTSVESWFLVHFLCVVYPVPLMLRLVQVLSDFFQRQVSCVSGVSSTGVSILSVSLLFSPIVFIRSLLNSGNKLEAQGRSSAENGSLVNRTCLRFLL